MYESLIGREMQDRRTGRVGKVVAPESGYAMAPVFFIKWADGSVTQEVARFMDPVRHTAKHASG